MRPRASSCPPGPAAGFTLVETLICLALLAGVAVSLAATTVAAARSVETSVRRAEALALASSLLEILQAAPADHPWCRPGGDLERSLVTASGTWSTRAGAYEMRWRIRPLRGLDLDLIEVVVHRHGAVPGGPPVARLRGCRGGLVP